MSAPPRHPAVPIDHSVSPDGQSVVCLECGRLSLKDGKPNRAVPKVTGAPSANPGVIHD